MKHANRLNELGFCPVELQKKAISNVTTAWKIAWSEDMIARDILQNVYDANRDNIHAIRTSGSVHVARIDAPTPFDLWRLYYLGSEKQLCDVGGYGEGFKAAAVSYLRTPGRAIYAASGDSALAIYPDDEPVQGTTTLYPLVYEFFSIEPIDGSVLILDQCSDSLAKILSQAIEHFFYPSNPCLGEKLWSDSKLIVYRSSGQDGSIFYRSLKRGVLKGIPLIFVLTKPYAEVEKKIGSDRDRKSFSHEIRDFFLRLINSKSISGNLPLQKLILDECVDDWKIGNGNSLLEIMSKGYCHELSARINQIIAPDRFYAATPLPYSEEGRIQHYNVIKTWQDEGLIELPGYFAKFGVKTIENHLSSIQQVARKEAMAKGQRPPTPQEMNAIELLRDCLTKLAPALASVFANGQVNYLVGRTEVLLGQLKQARSYRSKDVYFSEDVFVKQFSTALSIFLHEHSHVFGHDGNRGFSDSLTELIEEVVTHRKLFDSLERRWNSVAKSIKLSRESALESNDLIRTLAKLPKKDLVERLESLPVEVLTELLTDKTESGNKSHKFADLVL